jgi:nucleotide-binding universal stress UspA family protein
MFFMRARRHDERPVLRRRPIRGTVVALGAFSQAHGEAEMYLRPTILCPVDFSDASAGALRYAVAIASHFRSRLIVLTVEDPWLTEVVDTRLRTVWSPEECERELAAFVRKTAGRATSHLTCEYEVAVGKPASEILRVSRERSCRLIVMSTHGLTGAQKLFIGSTTERVLRETTEPVLLTPPTDAGPARFGDAARLLRRLLVPVDLSDGSSSLVRSAAAIGRALHVPMVVAHVVEPVKTRLASRLRLTGLQADRRAVAEDRLKELTAGVPPAIQAEALVGYGDPAEELAKIASDRHVGLIVIGLHACGFLRPRIGSVTYRLLCLTRTLVLVVPPERARLSVGDALGVESALSMCM